jgi:uncharacterized protein YqgC (DUF456 family)
MDILLIIMGSILIISGLLGCFLPILPGPPLSYFALILLQFTSKKPFTTNELAVLAMATIIVTALDYFVPIWGTKKFGGSKYGVWGSTIGLIAGMFLFPPFGIIIGPFIGALIGELVAGKNSQFALKSAFGSFIGFITGTFLKLITSFVITWYFFKALF